MIVIANYGTLENENHSFDVLARKHRDKDMYLIPDLTCNLNDAGETVGVDEAVYTKDALRQMRRARSFRTVDQDEYFIAKTATDPTAREQALITQEAEDFVIADAEYEARKTASRNRLAAKTVAVIDTVAEELGHTWSSGTLLKAEKIVELIDAGLV